MKPQPPKIIPKPSKPKPPAIRVVPENTYPPYTLPDKRTKYGLGGA